MTYEENVRAILESNFVGFKEDIIDVACRAICGLRTYGEWISCSERLPEEDGKYLVCWCGAWGVDICFAEYSKSGKYWHEKYGGEYRGITAWMPLPKPYEKEEIQKTYSTKLECVGFSQHDCESHYKCPFCGKQYGSWSIPINKPFKCKCGNYVWTD